MSTAELDHEAKEQRSKVKYIRGWPFPNAPSFPTENIIAALDYKPLDGDIILCSYPKTGTTWMQYIIWQILHKAESFPKFNDLSSHLAPFMEKSGIEPVKNLKEPRFYKNHFPYHLMTINDKAKYVYIYRNPQDTLASFYHFLNEVSEEQTEFDEYFENFMLGRVSYGDYFDHVFSFYDHKNDSNLLLVSYEDLHKDKQEQIFRIAKFLGDSYHKILLDDESLLQKILEVTNFDYMKNNVKLLHSTKDGSKRKIDFFRKGIVGDGKNLLSEEQKTRLRKKMLMKMTGTEFVDIWSS